jgi:cation diffusion facilitator CzcD-associated flavoprotein CzcO
MTHHECRHEAQRPRSIAVIGAGIVGTATALALAARGHTVTVFDHGEVGAGTSFGNAGAIVTGAVTPTATPGVIRSIPSYVFDRNSAAVLRPAHLLRHFRGFPVYGSGPAQAGFEDRMRSIRSCPGPCRRTWPWPA